MKDYLSIADFTPAKLRKFLSAGAALKSLRGAGRRTFRPLAGRSVALLFEKPSLRTRVTFELAVTELGGHAVYLSPQEVGIGKRESAADIARNLSRWVHAIVARTFKHETLAELSKNASVPVINALTDLEHPCQALGDILTILERKGKLKGVKLAFIGDGNNVCNSLLYGAAKTGMTMRVACPRGFEPRPDVFTRACREAESNCASVGVTHDPAEAVLGADAVYTDVWVSMGFEEEADRRRKAFLPFRVDSALMAKAKADSIFLHCLPARRGEEVTDEVLDGPRSAVLDQAENRLHTAKAVLLALMAPKEFEKTAREKNKRGKVKRRK